jgi:hypothetical protein
MLKRTAGGGDGVSDARQTAARTVAGGGTSEPVAATDIVTRAANGGAHSHRWRHKRAGDGDSDARRSVACTVAGGGTSEPAAATEIVTRGGRRRAQSPLAAQASRKRRRR